MNLRSDRLSKTLAGSLAALAMAGSISLVHAQPVLPSVQSQGSIEYMSGGIGQTQIDAMKAVANKYPLTLTFSQKMGGAADFLANFPVTIKGADGKTIFQATSGGPYMFVKIPAGTYTIVAVNNGKTLERQAVVNATGSTPVSFEWWSCLSRIRSRDVQAFNIAERLDFLSSCEKQVAMPSMKWLHATV